MFLDTVINCIDVLFCIISIICSCLEFVVVAGRWNFGAIGEHCHLGPVLLCRYCNKSTIRRIKSPESSVR